MTNEERDAEIESIHATLLRTQAMCFSLEGLCVALASLVADRSALMEQFEKHAELLDVKLLFGSNTPDVVVHEFAQARARTAGLISVKRDPLARQQYP